MAPSTTGKPDFFDITRSYGTVTADEHGADKSTPYPFTPETVVPAQAAASYYNPSFVADGVYTAGLSPYGNGNPSDHVGNNYFIL
jgi:hypothetical protein